MRLVIFATLLTASLLAVIPNSTEAGVSISVGEPHFYGHIDIGDYPPPRLIYEQPVRIRRVNALEQPVYLRVPPRHWKSWHRHCGEYNACGRSVYFINDDWYRDVYVPRYREHRPEYRGYHRPQPTYDAYRSHRYRPPHRSYRHDEYRHRHHDGNRNRQEYYRDRR